MAIDIQPPNYSGLAAIAGNTDRPLNLHSAGALGLQALQQQQSNENALRANDLANRQLQQQGQLALGTQRVAQQAMDQQAVQQQRQGLLDQNNLAMRRQEFGATGAQNATDNAYKQQQLAQTSLSEKDNLDLQNRILAETTAKDQMVKTLALSKQEIQNQGAFASYGLMSMKGAKTPEEANTIRAEINKEAVSKGYLTQTQADAANALPLSQYTNGLAYQVMAKGMTKEHKDMVEASKPVPDITGLTQVRDPQTGTLVYSSSASKSEISKLQGDIVGAKDSLREIKNIYGGVTDKMFGAGALGQNLTQIRALLGTIPGAGKYLDATQEDKDALTQYNNMQAATNGLSMDVIKEKSGVQYSDNQLQFILKILPQIGPTHTKAEFDGRTQNLERYLNAVIQSREDLLKNKFKLGTPEFESAMSQKIDDIQAHFFDKPKGPTDADRQFYKQNGKSDTEIDAYYQGKK